VDTDTLSTEVFHMGKTMPPYAPEFRQQIIELVRAGRDPASLAREFEPSAQAIRNWVAQADRQEGRREAKSGSAANGEALATAERDELARLRREVRQLRVERDILSRAAAWFARETGAIPSGSSGS
jgi:transposase